MRLFRIRLQGCALNLELAHKSQRMEVTPTRDSSHCVALALLRLLFRWIGTGKFAEGGDCDDEEKKERIKEKKSDNSCEA